MSGIASIANREHVVEKRGPVLVGNSNLRHHRAKDASRVSGRPDSLLVAGTVGQHMEVGYLMAGTNV